MFRYYEVTTETFACMWVVFHTTDNYYSHSDITEHIEPGMLKWIFESFVCEEQQLLLPFLF